VKHTQRAVPVSTLSNGHRVEVVVHELTSGRPGPALGIVGGVHGDEPQTVEYVRVLLEDLARLPLAGKVIAVTCGNPLALRSLTRNTPDDMIDLNRVFPGDPDGLLSHQLAHALFTVFRGNCDVFLDFHCGGILPTVDYVYIHGDEALARSFGSRVLYSGAPYVGALSDTLRQAGARCVVVEIGGGQVDQAPYVSRVREGVPNLLRAIGMLDGEVTRRDDQVVVDELRIVRPHHGGLLISDMRADELGTVVPGGHRLGRILHTQTLEELEVLRAPFERSILVLVRQGYTPVNPGDYAYMLGNAGAGPVAHG
jgi:predicted deacylase